MSIVIFTPKDFSCLKTAHLSIYNLDLEKDKEAISKKGIFRGRVEHCLVSDEVFLKTHLPKS